MHNKMASAQDPYMKDYYNANDDQQKEYGKLYKQKIMFRMLIMGTNIKDVGHKIWEHMRMSSSNPMPNSIEASYWMILEYEAKQPHKTK